jgi:hypothetical protein
VNVVNPKIASLFDGYPEDFTLIAQVQNSVFGFDFQGHQAILRVTPEGIARISKSPQKSIG